MNTVLQVWFGLLYIRCLCCMNEGLWLPLVYTGNDCLHNYFAYTLIEITLLATLCKTTVCTKVHQKGFYTIY